ncbi:MAG: hypothetical protein A2177_13810 [Spirochaetes bacterium RBG_13_68_11]|nr:MAG: hypothetical protein A2177_13810 [Spirochaetes bacterium RBG_13_68_11]
MLAMNQIDQVKELQRQGYGAKEIAARLSIDRKTTAKYMQREDFNAVVAPGKQAARSSPTAPR